MKSIFDKLFKNKVKDTTIPLSLEQHSFTVRNITKFDKVKVSKSKEGTIIKCVSCGLPFGLGYKPARKMFDGYRHENCI